MSSQPMLSCREPRPFTSKAGQTVWGLVDSSWRVVNIVSEGFHKYKEGGEMCRCFEAEWRTADGMKLKGSFYPAIEGNLKPNTQEFRQLLVKTGEKYSKEHFAATADRISPV